MTTYEPMTETDMRNALHLAVILHYGTLPQLKGKGAVIDTEQRTQAISRFADRLAEQLLLSNIVLAKGPPRDPRAVL